MTENLHKRNRATSAVHIPGHKDCVSSLHEGPRSLPMTSEFFFRKQNQPDGFSPVCKVCHVKAATAGKDRAQILKQKLGAKAILVLNGKTEKADLPHLARLAEQLTSYGGGLDRICQRFWHDVKTATPGSPHRLKAAQSYFQLIAKTTELGHADKPVELMTDDELVKLLDEKVPQLAESLMKAQALLESDEAVGYEDDEGVEVEDDPDDPGDETEDMEDEDDFDEDDDLDECSEEEAD